MIAMPLFPDEKWYFSQVKRFAVDGRIQNKKKIDAALKEIDDLLAEVISKDDFSVSNKELSLFECLVLASYEELEKIYKRISSDADSTFCDIITTLKGKKRRVIKEKWKKIYKIYDKLVDNDVNTELIQKYGVKCCPYCNENYIFNRQITGGKKYAMAQIDHFYPRDSFPIFAVSLYNLVPSCGSCNHIKSTKEIGISPHDQSHDFSQMNISYRPKSGNWINDAEEIEVQFQYDTDNLDFIKMMEKNLDGMGIKCAYDMHKDYIQEILKKAQIYGKEQRENLRNDFPDLFSSDDELMQVIFGNYINEEDLLKRPLSKMTKDLLKELSII